MPFKMDEAAIDAIREECLHKLGLDPDNKEMSTGQKIMLIHWLIALIMLCAEGMLPIGLKLMIKTMRLLCEAFEKVETLGVSNDTNIHQKH